MTTIKNTIRNESSLLEKRLFLNQFIRFVFDVPPDKSQLLDVTYSPQWKPLCEISGAFHLIDDCIQELLTDEGEKIKLLTEEYNRLFVGPNILPAPLWE